MIAGPPVTLSVAIAAGSVAFAPGGLVAGTVTLPGTRVNTGGLVAALVTAICGPSRWMFAARGVTLAD